ncbi:hypothetical protein BHS06_29020 [Myxococcus xanthus]|nr:hypothetical protein BHS06_29020 [Myxococcus xanthus]
MDHPLYLTAAYSLHVPGTNAQLPNRSRELLALAFNNIYSVVVQEMQHLELASNLFNALFAPKGDSAPANA